MKQPISVELLEKYINGTCTLQEAEQVKNWYLSFEDDDDHVSAISQAEEQALQEKIYNHILNNIGKNEGPEVQEEIPVIRKRFVQTWYFKAGAVAAAVVILFAGSLVLYNNQKAKMIQAADTNDDQLVTITNNTGQIYKAVLPDNSLVWLNPLSQLTYPKTFAPKSRIVSISGECFFEVTKNPQRPFIINSRAIVTKVWGTSFLVHDDDRSNSAEVSVRSEEHT